MTVLNTQDAEPVHAVLNSIIQSHQVILDRLREARTAVGTTGFNNTVHHDFASTVCDIVHDVGDRDDADLVPSKLYPYRLHSQRIARTLFYLNSTSLASKTPLGRDAPSSKPTWAAFERDALVLSRRLR